MEMNEQKYNTMAGNKCNEESEARVTEIVAILDSVVREVSSEEVTFE